MSARVTRGMFAGALIATLLTACSPAGTTAPPCDEPGHPTVILLAQSVPSATLVPCVSGVPAGWNFTATEIRDGEATLTLATNSLTGSVELRLTPTCDPGDAVEVVPAPGEEDATVLQAPDSLDPLSGHRYVVFDGGCATTTYDFPADMPASQALEADRAFSFLPRADVVEAVATNDGAVLCGAGAPPCEGSA